MMKVKTAIVPLLVAGAALAALNSAAVAQGTKRVTAQVQWSVKGQGAQQLIKPALLKLPTGEELLVPEDGSESFDYGVDVTLTFDADPNMLPGGMMSRATNGAPMIFGFIAGNVMPYGGKLIALNGTFSAKHELTQKQPCSPLKKNEHGMGSTGANAVLSGATKFDAGNATIQLTFQGDAPSHFVAGASGLKLSGDVRYACGQTAKMSLEPAFEMSLPFDPRSAGWVVATTKTPEGVVMTASWKGEEQGYKIEKFGKLTWSVK
jgi:hypothetical protein